MPLICRSGEVKRRDDRLHVCLATGMSPRENRTQSRTGACGSQIPGCADTARDLRELETGVCGLFLTQPWTG